MNNTETKTETPVTKKPKRTFLQYCEDPIFKAKHREYIKSKVACSVCGKVIARYNMTNHKKTKKCQEKGKSAKSEKQRQFEDALALALEMVLGKKEYKFIYFL